MNHSYMKKIGFIGFILLISLVSTSALEINHMHYISVFAENSTGSINANINGATSPQNFTIGPPANQTWY